MKSINNFVLERFNAPVAKDTVLHFKSLVPAYLYYAEFSGQISDGKYENASPRNHWEWVGYVDIVVDGNEYYTASYQHPKNNYSFSDFAKYIDSALKGDKEYLWSLRILEYGRMARVLESMGFKNVEEDLHLNVIAEIFGDTLYLNKDAEFKDTESQIPDYWKKYTSSKLYSKKYFDAFKEASYDLKDFKEDVKSMCKTINTFKRDENY